MSAHDPTGPFPVVDTLTVRSEAAADVGATLLAGGMASYRVKWAMARTAQRLGLDSFISVVSFTDIIATATLEGRYRTRITQPVHVGVNVDHLYRTQRMVETFPQSITAAEVFEQLARIRARGPLYGPLTNALAAGIACAAFAFLNQSGPVEMLAVLIAAAVGQGLRRHLSHRAWNHLLITLLAAAVSSSLYFAAVGLPTVAGWLPELRTGGYLSAVLYLVPGFPLITGILDLVRADYAAGLARLAYVSLMMFAAGASIWAVATGVGVETALLPPLQITFWPMLMLRALATAVGVLGFAVIFNSPWRIAVTAALVSAAANTLRFALVESGAPIQIATVLATTVVGVSAYIIVRATHVPRTSISVPAVVIMIPGYTLYAALTLLQNGEEVRSALLLTEGIQVVLAAALGLALAHLATSPAWRRIDHPR